MYDIHGFTQTISFWQKLLVLGFAIFKTSDSIKIIKTENSPVLFAKAIFKVYGRQAGHNMIVMNVIARSYAVIFMEMDGP